MGEPGSEARAAGMCPQCGNERPCSCAKEGELRFTADQFLTAEEAAEYDAKGTDPARKEELKKKNLELIRERAELESETRAARVERLTSKTNELFEGEGGVTEELRGKVVGSFNVPQWGKYHNEGMLMDTHLDRVFSVLDAVYEGRLDEIIDSGRRGSVGDEKFEQLKAKLKEIVRQAAAVDGSDEERQAARTALEKYAFLHDLSKVDSLSVKHAGGQGTALHLYDENDEGSLGFKQYLYDHTYSEAGRPVEQPDVTDPAQLADFLGGTRLEGISYYHDTKTMELARDKRKHGDHAADYLQGKSEEIGIDDLTVSAIRNHEVGFQFGSVGVKTYDKHFGNLNPEERIWAIAASFIDQASSLQRDGRPDLDCIFNLLESKECTEAIEAIVKALHAEFDRHIDAGKIKWNNLQQEVNRLKKKKSREDIPTPQAFVKEMLDKFSADLTEVAYNLDGIREELEGEIDGEVLDSIILLLEEGGSAKDVGREFGRVLKRDMGKVKKALSNNEE